MYVNRSKLQIKSSQLWKRLNLFFVECAETCKLADSTKINENLTTNVLILIYIYFFLLNAYLFYNFFFLMWGAHKEKEVIKQGGCRQWRKAWHIWSDISFFSSLFILSAYGVIVFLYPHVSFYLCCFVFYRIGKKQKQ